MEKEIIQTENKDIVIERTITEIEINIQAIKDSILENGELAESYRIKKENLENFIANNDNEEVNEALRTKVGEYESLMVGFLMEKSKGENYLTNLIK